MYIIFRKFCFVHFIFTANQAALEKKPVAIESVAFCFFVNCSFNNTFLTLNRQLLIYFHEIPRILHWTLTEVFSFKNYLA